ncbi:MAG: methyltransferase domain-containing protein [Rhodothermales bacterium]
MQTDALQRAIQRFYDVSTPLWEDVWGDHLHHGYYGSDGSVRKAPYEAQVDLVEALRRFGRLEQAGRILDAGCGVGGSALYLARKLGAEVEGITLSPVQARSATARAEAAGLGDRVRFSVADALAPPFEPASFDAVWALESAEHFPDKSAWLATCARLLRPGGRLVAATWCIRPSPPDPGAAERRLLRRLYGAYHLPDMISLPDYLERLAGLGFDAVCGEDWTGAVAPFWGEVVRSAMRPASLAGLLRAGWPTIRGALAMRHMMRGYRTGLIRFGVFTAVRR